MSKVYNRKIIQVKPIHWKFEWFYQYAYEIETEEAEKRKPEMKMKQLPILFFILNMTLNKSSVEHHCFINL